MLHCWFAFGPLILGIKRASSPLQRAQRNKNQSHKLFCLYRIKPLQPRRWSSSLLSLPWSLPSLPSQSPRPTLSPRLEVGVTALPLAMFSATEPAVTPTTAKATFLYVSIVKHYSHRLYSLRNGNTSLFLRYIANPTTQGFLKWWGGDLCSHSDTWCDELDKFDGRFPSCVGIGSSCLLMFACTAIRIVNAVCFSNQLFI